MAENYRTTSDLALQFHISTMTVSLWYKQGIVRRIPMPLDLKHRTPWFKYCVEDVVKKLKTKKQYNKSLLIPLT